MAQSSWHDGCPITTTLLEMAADDAAIRQAGQDAFAAWSEVIAAALCRDGVAEEEARRLAAFSIAALEGALVQARVEQDAAPIREAAAQLERLFRSAM